MGINGLAFRCLGTENHPLRHNGTRSVLGKQSDGPFVRLFFSGRLHDNVHYIFSAAFLQIAFRAGDFQVGKIPFIATG